MLIRCVTRYCARLLPAQRQQRSLARVERPGPRRVRPASALVALQVDSYVSQNNPASTDDQHRSAAEEVSGMRASVVRGLRGAFSSTTSQDSSSAAAATAKEAPHNDEELPFRGIDNNATSPNRRTDELSLSPDQLIVNSRTRQMHLNAHQQSVVWKLRQDQYHGCLHRVVTVLQSHLTLEEKCHRLLLLHDRVVIPKRLRLRSDTYEEIFHLFYVNANHAATLSDAATSSKTTTTAAFLDAVWTMYRYMIDSGTNPTPAIVQHLMGVLDRVTTRNANVEAKAHSLMMDCDRFGFPPTNFTLESYCAVCEVNRAMHLALARVTDSMTRHEQQGTGGVFQRLLHGLVVNGQSHFALQVIQQLNHVSLSDGLLDTVLFAMRHSSQPEAAISMYRSVVAMGNRNGGSSSSRNGSGGGGVRPTSLTISILVGVLCGDDNKVVDVEVVRRHLPFVVGEMLRYRVPASNDTLNRVLHGYHRIGDRASFMKFLRSMRQRNRRVFSEQFPADWLEPQREEAAVAG